MSRTAAIPSSFAVASGLLLLLLAAAVSAQQSVQEAIDEVIYETVDATLQRASAVVSRRRSVDAYRHGFADDDVTPTTLRLPVEMRRALDKLRYEYNRDLVRLEQKLRHELTRLGAAFRRDTGRDVEVEEVQARRADLEKAVQEAWQIFEREVTVETKRASERRARIIAPLLDG